MIYELLVNDHEQDDGEPSIYFQALIDDIKNTREIALVNTKDNLITLKSDLSIKDIKLALKPTFSELIDSVRYVALKHA